MDVHEAGAGNVVHLRQVSHVVTHQPQLFPYAGFWHKVANAQLVGLTVDVKMDYAGYQNRVPFGNGWLTARVEKQAKHKLLKDVRLADGFRPADLIPVIRGRISKKTHPYQDRLDPILSILDAFDTEWLVDLNIAMIELIMTILNIKAALIEVPPKLYQGQTKSERLFERLARIAHPSTYIAGPGTAAYIDCNQLHGWKLLLQTHDPIVRHSDTVLDYLGRYVQPLEAMKAGFQLVPWGAGSANDSGDLTASG